MDNPNPSGILDLNSDELSSLFAELWESAFSVMGFVSSMVVSNSSQFYVLPEKRKITLGKCTARVAIKYKLQFLEYMPEILLGMAVLTAVTPCLTQTYLLAQMNKKTSKKIVSIDRGSPIEENPDNEVSFMEGMQARIQEKVMAKIAAMSEDKQAEMFDKVSKVESGEMDFLDLGMDFLKMAKDNGT